MSVYAIGSDKINGKEQSYINQAVQAIQQAGHETTTLGVHPNTVQSHGLTSASSGQIGVMIVGGRGLGTPMDFHTGVTNGYYHYTHVYVIGSSEFTGNNLISSSSMTTPVNVCEPGMNASQCSKYKGLTPEQFNEKYTACTVIYCDSFSEGLKTLLGGDSTSTEEQVETSGGTFKEAIKDLIKVWDGQVEAWLDGAVMNIRHIPEPEEKEPVSKIQVTIDPDGKTRYYKEVHKKHNILREPEVWASEGVNIVHDTLSMTDYNPDNYNKLIVNYTDEDSVSHSIAFFDQILIDRFGEVSTSVDAVSYTHSSEESSDEESETTSTVETPITSYDEALSFGYGEWFKLQRSNGHQVECKVIGSNYWRVGRWCKIYLPVFSEYCDMYINRVSHTFEEGVWLTSIECLPAPACIKEDDSNTNDEDNEDSTTGELLDEETLEAELGE